MLLKEVTQDASVTGQDIRYKRVALLLCPTGTYCREDRCQSYFKFHLIPSVRAPLEECEMAGALQVLNIPALIVDAPAENLTETEFLQRISEFSPDLIVLSVTFGSLEQDLNWAAKFKAIFPEVTIGLRGAPCYMQYLEIMKNVAIDFCLRGDYELAISSLIQNGLSETAGLVYRQGAEVFSNPHIPLAQNLDSLPLPDRSTLKQNLYKVRALNKTQATIHVQRGCPFPCTYCLVHTVSGKKARHRSPDSIVAEMKDLIKQKINYFYLRADTFTLDKAWVLQLCDTVKRYVPTARWVTTTRVDLVDEEIIAAMKNAGCYGISFGLDVASKEIAQKVKKEFREEQAIKAVNLCHQYKIISLCYIMIGFIWDNIDTIKEAQKLILKLKSDLITVHFAYPYPGTSYYKEFKKLDYKLVSGHAQSEAALGTPELSAEDFEKFARHILLKHYLRPGVLFRLVKKILG